MSNLIAAIVRVFKCWVLDLHEVPIYERGDDEHGNGKIGDYYDLFGACKYCNQECHKDTHMYGHDGWKRETK